MTERGLRLEDRGVKNSNLKTGASHDLYYFSRSH
jgi:hypothetical protein